MRTDGTNISNDAISLFRDYIKNEYGNEYLPKDALNYSGKKAKNAQEAHEAFFVWTAQEAHQGPHEIIG